MMQIPDLSSYVSPLSWRYGTPRMRKLFSEEYKYRLWRKIWVAIATVQHEAGLVTKEELADLKKYEEVIDSKAILAIEEETKHDVVAAIREFAGRAKVGGKKIHLGATSMDITDNADALRVTEALSITKENVKNLLVAFGKQIQRYADVPCMGYTHLQPAEPTTVGYRLAMYASDLLTDLEFLGFVVSIYKGKGMKGAVGTRASYKAVLDGTNITAEKLDSRVMELLGIQGAAIASQVYPRKYDYLVMTVVASIASSVSKFASDVRLLQSPAIGEWSEPFGTKQVGSSAMPFKRNPASSEKICSLARYIGQLPAVALENASLNHLERTLDDSANRRLILSEGFIALDEILASSVKIVEGLVVNTKRIAYNSAQYAPFAATEVLLIALVKKGADRQKMHELLREISMQSWEAVQYGKPNPMANLLETNKIIRMHLSQLEIQKCCDITHHIGDSPQRAIKLAQIIKQL